MRVFVVEDDPSWHTPSAMGYAWKPALSANAYDLAVPDRDIFDPCRDELVGHSEQPRKDFLAAAADGGGGAASRRGQECPVVDIEVVSAPAMLPSSGDPGRRGR